MGACHHGHRPAGKQALHQAAIERAFTRNPRRPNGISETSMSGRTPFWRRLFQGWMSIVARFGFVQTLVILSVIYALVIGPMAVGSAVARRDFLRKRELRVAGSAWHEADSAEPTLDRAKQAS